MHISRNVRFFLNELFFQEGGDINTNDFTSTVIPELTIFEGTHTLMNDALPHTELPSGGELEQSLEGEMEHADPQESPSNIIEVHSRRSTWSTRPASRL
jgi:hypothetical protein